MTRDRIAMPLLIGIAMSSWSIPAGTDSSIRISSPEHIAHQIELAMAQAKLVLFVVGCTDGLTSADEEIAAMLRKRSAKAVIIANKADGAKNDTILGEFARLGLGTPIGVSAMNDRNIDQVFEAIAQNLDLSDAPRRCRRRR